MFPIITQTYCLIWGDKFDSFLLSKFPRNLFFEGHKRGIILQETFSLAFERIKLVISTLVCWYSDWFSSSKKLCSHYENNLIFWTRMPMLDTQHMATIHVLLWSSLGLYPITPYFSEKRRKIEAQRPAKVYSRVWEKVLLIYLEHLFALSYFVGAVSWWEFLLPKKYYHRPHQEN